MAKGKGRKETGIRRGAGQRKHGLARWATIWLDDIFDYINDREFVASAGSEWDIDDLYEIADKWQDIGGMMGGTVFLDWCQNASYQLASKAFSKAARLEARYMF